jgi:surfeit locus 1 family protein
MGDYQFYLDNRQQDGVAGYQVLTPFKPAGHERWILVNRGWRAWPQGKRGQPEESIPTGEWTLIGQVDIPSNKAFFMMSNAAGTDGRLHMKVDLKAFEAWSKYSVEPIVLQEISGPDDGLSRRWPVAEDRTLMHRGYAYQWWCMVLVTVLFYLYASLKKRPEAS